MDWPAFLKDFGFPVTMAVGLLILLTKNMEDVKNALNDMKTDTSKLLTDTIGKLSTNQTMIISMVARLNDVADSLASNQIATTNMLTANQMDVANKLAAYQADLATKLAAAQVEVANKLLTIQTLLANQK